MNRSTWKTILWRLLKIGPLTVEQVIKQLHITTWQVWMVDYLLKIALIDPTTKEFVLRPIEVAEPVAPRVLSKYRRPRRHEAVAKAKRQETYNQGLHSVQDFPGLFSAQEVAKIRQIKAERARKR